MDEVVAQTRWWHGRGGGTDEAGNTDVGVAQMRGTTEGGRMRAAAWTRWHGRGGTDEAARTRWHRPGSTDEAAQTRCTAWTRGPGGQHE